MLTEEVEKALKELHLPVMRESYQRLSERATKESVPYVEYLYWLLEGELEERRVKRIGRRLEESKIPLLKRLDSFDMKRLPPKLSRQIQGLLTGDFIRQRENLLLFGSPGSGKTHLLAAIGQELIRNQNMRVQFIPSTRLLQELLIAKKSLQLVKLLKKLTSYEGVIIDDIGYIEQTKEEAELLFTFISECYEKTSILLTSNLPFSKWDQIFKDAMMANAAIDRLVHHSVILEMNVSSYRMEKAQEKKESKEGL